MIQGPVRIRSILLLLTGVVLAPGFLAAAVAIEKVRDAQRESALRGLTETVRATALLVDGQLQRSIGALTALGNSPSIQTANDRAFYQEAAALDAPPDVWTMLLDKSGKQRINTRVPFGTQLPPPVAQERVAQALATQRPVVSDLIVGPVSKKLLTTVYVPAKADPFGQFVVAQAFSVDHWKKTALQPQGRDRWIVGVIDHQGRFISRSHGSDQMLGRQARPELVAAAAASHDGLIRHATLEGVDSYDAFTHSDLTGWTIAIAAPVTSIENSATQAVRWLLAGGITALAFAVIGALGLSRTRRHCAGVCFLPRRSA